MSWLSRNAPSVEAAAALITAAVAVAALIGVKVQLDEADRLQKANSAREAYRAHLALAATLPAFAQPQDACQLISSPQGGAYAAFVDHLLYSAEQMLDVSDGWDSTFTTQLEHHSAYVCTHVEATEVSADLSRLLVRFQGSHCPATPACE